MKTNIDDRRKFILQLAKGSGLIAMGTIVWSTVLQESVASSLTLRPPGALKEKEFLKTCIKCGLCVVACPYDTLKLASLGDHIPLGTPYFIARKTPCYMCVDIPCVPICPTDALDSKSVTHNNVLDINSARMGVAIVDSYSCVAFWGIQCDACYRACPLIDKAIVLEYKHNKRTQKHAFLIPVVVPDVCTGCGICEHVCITKKAAITVLPRRVAMGEVDDHYVKGWDEKDQLRINGSKTFEFKTKISKKDALDSLNDDRELFK